MEIIEKIKLNDEVIDSSFAFYKGAEVLINDDKSNFDTIYAYLLLQATLIERLQKIVYMVNFYDKNKKQVTDNELKISLGHKILDIHKKNFVNYIEKKDSIYIEKSLDILTKLVTVKGGYRYINFNLQNNEMFDMAKYIGSIFDVVSLINIKNCSINDLKKHSIASLNIIHIILKKYTAVLVNLLWNRKIGNDEVTLIPFQELITKGFYEINLEIEIKDILLKYKFYD
ncbi:hypothetical protein [Malaciobacter marinus]|uniref:hypothetical protein n=1 Tax=Malaciobacter marinus TaxID=505249 RepID=UPI003B007AAE